MENNNNHEHTNMETHEHHQVSPKKDYFMPVSILVAAVLVAGAILFATLYKGGSTAPVAGGNATTTAQTGATTPVDPSVILKTYAGDAVTGNANAPVTVTEYGDYQCPFCGQFFSQVEPTIMTKYVNTGKVKFVFRDFAFLGAESTAAGEAADCAADQNQAFAYHNALYTAKVADVAAGGSEDDGFFNRTLFLKLANQLGLNTTSFASCLDTNKYSSQVAQEVSNASAAGVDSTPTVFVNGKEVLDATGHSVGANGPAILQAISAVVGS